MSDFLYSLASSNDRTDRTEEIVHLLTKHGVCQLGAGDFYVKNLTMPEQSTLMGCGNATRVILDESVADGFAVRMQSLCTVKDFFLLGDPERGIPAPGTDKRTFEDVVISETLGTRHGIVWCGNYDKDQTDVPFRGAVANLTIRGFSGGGITEHNTGYSIQTGLNVSDCFIFNCGAGINIDYWSEFNRYTNVNCCRNYYGAINNGGNNVFANCCFSCNYLGMLMDNSRGQSPNNSHGSVLGCTFDHSDHNNGVGLRLIGMHNGEIFTNCQIFFSKIELENSDGIVFSNINFGREEQISITDGGVVQFNNCIFRTVPTVTVRNNPLVLFNNCFTRDGNAIAP